MFALTMTPNSSHRDSTEPQSRSSAARFQNYEPFESFQPKVAAVACKHFQLPASKIKVEHMKGGSYNRVAGVTLIPQPDLFSFEWLRSWLLSQSVETSTPETPTSESYVVRVPRFQEANYKFTVDRDVAILKTVGALLDLPIPKVEAYDLTCNNPIGKPYLIQPRLPGENLSRLLISKALNLEQMKSIAKQVTRITETIAKVEGPGGNISLKALDDPFQLHIESLHLEHDVLGDKSYAFPDPLPDTLEHLLKICQRWYECYRADCHPFYKIWCYFAMIVKSLYERDFLDGPCVLAHRDLEEYNLLAEKRSETEVEITGVIDWDSATIAPEFVAYKAPFWLWAVCNDDLPSGVYDQEETAILPPANEEAAIIKQVFMETASEKFKFFAFAPEAMLARRMYLIMKEGFCSDWYIMEAEDIIRDWIKLHPEDKIPFEDRELKLGPQQEPVPDCESESCSDSDSDSGVMSNNGSEDAEQS